MTTSTYTTSGTFNLSMQNAKSKESMDFDAEHTQLTIEYHNRAPAKSHPDSSDVEILNILAFFDCVIPSTSHEGIQLIISAGANLSMLFSDRTLANFRDEIAYELSRQSP